MSIAAKDLLEEALARFLEQFKDKPNFEALVTALTTQAQDGQDAVLGILNDTSINLSEGVQLDGIGEIVGEPRFGRSDADYRVGIHARLLIHKSHGTPEELIAITLAIIGPTYVVRIVEAYPASFSLYVTGTLTTAQATILADRINAARPAGVGTGVIYSEVEDADAFFFSTGDTEEASATQGWADDAQTSGGAFSDVIGA